jgi:hypothetical protein
MENKEFGKVLENRTLEFALAVLRNLFKLPKNPEYGVIRNQLTKSVCSIGAN